MARYSKVTLIDKVMIFRTVLKVHSIASGSQLNSMPSVCQLSAIRTLNSRYLATNILTLSLFLRANYHSTGFNQIEEQVNKFVECGYVMLSGVSKGKIYITDLGKAALNDLETELRTSHYKFKRDSSGKIKVPGVKRK